MSCNQIRWRKITFQSLHFAAPVKYARFDNKYITIFVGNPPRGGIIR